MLPLTSSRQVLRRLSTKPVATLAADLRLLNSRTCRRTLLTAAFTPVRAPRPLNFRSTPATRRSAYTSTRLVSERVETAKAPSAADLEDAEIDAEVMSQDQIQLQVSDRAAEKLKSTVEREGKKLALRISVESGGCHGYQTKLAIVDPSQAAPEDYILSHPTISNAQLVVDAVSLPLLNGSTVDYATELIGSSFRVIDNPNAAGKGCGCGVSWELKADA